MSGTPEQGTQPSSGHQIPAQVQELWAHLGAAPYLPNQRVLVLNSDAGWIAHLCALGGAREVLALESEQAKLDQAVQRFGSGSVRFQHSTWEELPANSFDIVIWANGLHQTPRPRNDLTTIHKLLSSTGILILECGVLDLAEESMIIRADQGTEYAYPTTLYLANFLLESFSTRLVSKRAKAQKGYTARAVYHCRRRRPRVLFVTGRSGAGKTDMARQLASVASQVISLDVVLSRLATQTEFTSDLAVSLRGAYNPQNLGPSYSLVNGALQEQFVQWLGRLITDERDFAIFEGNASDATVEAFREAHKDLDVWQLRRP